MSSTLPRYADREAQLLAPYAMHSADTAGREHAEPAHPYRGPFQRDRDRIVHSSAFRRLAHKTQVFTGEMGDYHRSRLTHTLEVASIARTVGRSLRLNEDFIEALALMHDIGHPPFGHAGEDVLNDCLADQGGFNHNAQALRIVEKLERRYPNFPGLNLSQEVLAGQRVRGAKQQPGELLPLIEVQVVDAADSIAYDAHDADDAVALGLLELDELAEAPLWARAADEARRRYAALTDDEFRRATVHELLDLLVGDLLAATNRRLCKIAPANVEEATAHTRPLAASSDEIAGPKLELETLLFERVYRHPTVLQQRRHAAEALEGMFQRLVKQPELLPSQWLARAKSAGVPRSVADYLAGMTDRFALEEHGRLDPT